MTGTIQKAASGVVEDVSITLGTGWASNSTWCERAGELILLHFYVVGTATRNKVIASGLPAPRHQILLFTNHGVITFDTNGTLSVTSLATMDSTYGGQTLAYFAA